MKQTTLAEKTAISLGIKWGKSYSQRRRQRINKDDISKNWCGGFSIEKCF